MIGWLYSFCNLTICLFVHNNAIVLLNFCVCFLCCIIPFPENKCFKLSCNNYIETCDDNEKKKKATPVVKIKFMT